MTGFLDLPPEIRNEIYFHTESLIASLNEETTISVVDYPDEVNMVRWGKWCRRYEPVRYRPNRFITQPSITRVSKAVREETLPIFYGANAFIVTDLYWPEADGIQTPFPKIILEWLDRIRAHLPLMTDVEIDCHPRSCPHQAHEMVSALTDLMPFRAGVLKSIDGAGF